MTIDTTRRRLLQGTAAAAGLGAFPGMTVIRGAQAAPVGPTTLITIHLDGGNDTLNTVIPYANPLYYQLRGSLAIPATSSLPPPATRELTAQVIFHSPFFRAPCNREIMLRLQVRLLTFHCSASAR